MPPSKASLKLDTMARDLLRLCLKPCLSGTLVGLGADLIAVDRLRKHGSEKTARSFLTPEEWTYCASMGDPPRGWSALWAAREALYKATSGHLEVYPLSWRLWPGAEGRWNPAPRKPGEAWEAFRSRHALEVTLAFDAEHAMALAAVTAREAPPRSRKGAR